MAEDGESRIRALFEKVMRRQREQPPAPETSYFDRKEPDREAERQQAEERKAAERRMATQREEQFTSQPERRAHPMRDAMEATKATPTSQAFDKASEVGRHKEQQVFQARFRSEPAQAAALEALEEAAKLRDLNDERLHAALEAQQAIIRQWGGPMRPMSPEGGRAVNEAMQRARDTHKQENETIARDLDMAMHEAERLNPTGWGFTKPGPQRRLTGPEPEAAEPFNQAAREDWLTNVFNMVQHGITVPGVTSGAIEPEPTMERSMGHDETPDDDWLERLSKPDPNAPDLGPRIGPGR